MKSSIPCGDKVWHKIYSSLPGGTFAHVFVKFNGIGCTFTARLIDDAPPPPPGAPPPVVPPLPAIKAKMELPTAGGWRGFNANFMHFEVMCEHAEGEGGHPEHTPEHPEHPEHPEPRPEQMPDVQAISRKDNGPAPALQECPFEWYMMI